MIKNVVMYTKNEAMSQKVPNIILPKFKTLIADWNEIPWTQCYNVIDSLQEALVMAYREGDLVRVDQIQRRIVTSFEGRALAVRRTVTNKGGTTPGVDGVI